MGFFTKDNTPVDQPKSNIYKGYDINWLRELGAEHPDFHLVAEYDALGDETETVETEEQPQEEQAPVEEKQEVE